MTCLVGMHTAAHGEKEFFMAKTQYLNTVFFTISVIALGACGADSKLPNSESVSNITTKKMDRKVPGDLKEAIAESQNEDNLGQQPEAQSVAETPERSPKISAGEDRLSGEENEDQRFDFYLETVDVIQASAQDDSLMGQQQFCGAVSALKLVSESESSPEGHSEQVFISGVLADHSEKFQSLCLDGANEALEDENEKMLISSLDEILVLNEDLKTAAEENREDDIKVMTAAKAKSSATYCQAIALLDTFRQSTNEWATAKANDIESKLLTNEVSIGLYCPFVLEIDIDKVFSLPGSEEEEVLEDAEQYFQEPEAEGDSQ